MLPTCRELGIGFVAYSPLGRGFLSGRFKSPDELDENDFRRHNPRFQGEAFDQQPARCWRRCARSPRRRAARPASSRSPGCSPRATTSSPIPGTKRRTYLEENLAAADVELTDDDLARIDAEVPEAEGDRYDRTGMTTVNR